MEYLEINETSHEQKFSHSRMIIMASSPEESGQAMWQLKNKL